MASIKLGSSISEIIGKVGGDVYQKNKQGLFLRQNSRRCKSNIPAMIRQTSRFSYLVSVWNSLTQSEHDNWDAWVPYFTWQDKLGRDYHPTSYQLFIHINQIIIGSSQGSIREYLPGGLAYATTLTVTSINKTASSAYVARSYALPALYAYKLFISRPYKASDNVAHPKWTGRAFFEYGFNPADNVFNILQALSTIPFAPGQKIYWKGQTIYLPNASFVDTSSGSTIVT
jgi:hypothetical protein